MLAAAMSANREPETQKGKAVPNDAAVDDEFDSLGLDPGSTHMRAGGFTHSLPPLRQMGRGRPIQVNQSASLSNLNNVPAPPTSGNDFFARFAKRDAQARTDRNSFPRTSNMPESFAEPTSVQSTPQWGRPFALNRDLPKVNRERRCYIVTIITFILVCVALAVGIILGLQKREASVRTGSTNNVQSTLQPCCSKDQLTCEPSYNNLCRDQNSCSAQCRGTWLLSPSANCCSTDGSTCAASFISNPLQCNANSTQCTTLCAGRWIAPSSAPSGAKCCSNDKYSCSTTLTNPLCNSDAALCQSACYGTLISAPSGGTQTTPSYFCCSTDRLTCNTATINPGCDASQQVCSQMCQGFYGAFSQTQSSVQGCCSFNMGQTCGNVPQCDASQTLCQSQCSGIFLPGQSSSSGNQCCSRDMQSCDVTFAPYCSLNANNCAQCGGFLIAQRNDATAVNVNTARYQQLTQVIVPSLLISNTSKLQDVTTPQARAMHWLANVDPLQVQASDTANLNPRYSLASLYYSTNGQFWFNSNGWLGSSSHCNWYGVSCDSIVTNPSSPGNVVSLNLERNNLVGPIPEELFSGLGKTLVDLDLHENKLNGTIPASTLPSMASLQVLSLYNNTLSGAIPSTIGNLANARRIYLDENSLTNRIPETIGALSQLQHFDVFNNRLYGSIPSEVGLLSNLQRLYLSNNSFWGNLPDQIGNMVQLTELYLDENLFNGGIPASIGNLNALRDFRAYSNNFQGAIPTTFGQLVNLQILYLDNNRLSGTIPDQIGQMYNLREISMFNNTLNGQIPPSIGTLANLQVLALSFNQLNGPIPSTLNQLTNLRILHLYGNQLQGGVPQLTGMTNLRDFFLYSNQLNGALPSWLNTMPSLDDVNLSSNQFQGTIPEGIVSASMKSLILNGNPQVSGTIPQQLCQQKQLGQLQTLIVDCQVQGCYTSCT